MKNSLRNFFRRIGKTGFLILLFILFGAWGFCRNGWLGLAAAIVGCGLGCFLYENWSGIKKFPWKKFFRQHLKAIVKLVILVPIVAACCYFYGWKGLLGSVLGVLVGEIISRKIFKLK